jgi:hypothetical protein
MMGKTRVSFRGTDEKKIPRCEVGVWGFSGKDKPWEQWLEGYEAGVSYVWV